MNKLRLPLLALTLAVSALYSADVKPKHVYNWHRDAIPKLQAEELYRGDKTTTFPASFDLYSFQPPRFDQAQEGSCTANSVNGELRAIHRLLAQAPDADFSRQYTYYQERVVDHSGAKVDAGSSIATSVEVVETYGAPLESDWSYDKAHFSLKPTAAINKEALLYRISGSTPVVNDATAFKSTIVTLKRAVLIGFTVYESFESDATARTGIMTIPKKGEQILGGHAVRIVGYDDNLTVSGVKGFYLVVNSWGTSWGDPKHPGCFWMPYDFVHKKKLADDFHYINGLLPVKTAARGLSYPGWLNTYHPQGNTVVLGGLYETYLATFLTN